MQQVCPILQNENAENFRNQQYQFIVNGHNPDQTLLSHYTAFKDDIINGIKGVIEVPGVSSVLSIKELERRIQVTAQDPSEETIQCSLEGGMEKYGKAYDQVQESREAVDSIKPKLSYNKIWWSTLLLLTSISVYTLGQSSVGAALYMSLQKAAENGCGLTGISEWISGILGGSVGRAENPFCNASRHFIFVSFTVFINHVWSVVGNIDVTGNQSAIIIAGIAGFDLLVKCIHWSLVQAGYADPISKTAEYTEKLKKYEEDNASYIKELERILGTNDFSNEE